jgi:hypothetical protein
MNNKLGKEWQHSFFLVDFAALRENFYWIPAFLPAAGKRRNDRLLIIICALFSFVFFLFALP